MKFEIKSWLNGGVLFSVETESLKMAVELAIKSKVSLRSADLSSVDLSSADLSSVDLSYADMRYADLRSANLSSADLSSADLSYADLSSADMRYADLRSADLSYADMRYADLSYADLSSADLSYADLSSADLSYADMRYADLSYADLSSADLSYADLSSADLSYADLSSVDLSYADLRSADLRSASGLNKFTTTPLYILADQPGKIRAYKLVKENGDGPFNGGITYKVGKAYEVSDADENETKQCAAGINLATLDWCIKEWKKDYRILIAEFTAKDIAALPIGSDGKFRVRKCKIVGEKNLKEIGISEGL